LDEILDETLAYLPVDDTSYCTCVEIDQGAVVAEFSMSDITVESEGYAVSKQTSGWMLINFLLLNSKAETKLHGRFGL
jgi:hypothetical protein